MHNFLFSTLLIGFVKDLKVQKQDLYLFFDRRYLLEYFYKNAVYLNPLIMKLSLNLTLLW